MSSRPASPPAIAGMALFGIEDLNTMTGRFPFNTDSKLLRIQTIPMSAEAVERNPLLAAMAKGGKSDPAKAQEAEELELRALQAPLSVALADNLKTFARAAVEEVFPALSSALGILTPNPIHTTHTLVVSITWHPEIKDATIAFTLDYAVPFPHAELEDLLGEKSVGMFSQDALNNTHGMKGARAGLKRCMTVWLAKWDGYTEIRMMPSGVPSIEEVETENLTPDELASRNDPNWFENLQARLKYSGLPSASPGGRASPRDFQRFERKY